jgi:hypothetical protein
MSISPLAARAGQVVSIKGRHFSSMPSDNHVFFGKVSGKVIEATDEELKVELPGGAQYGPISVAVKGLRSWSSELFTPSLFASVVRTNVPFVPRRLSTPAGMFLAGLADFDADGKLDLFFRSLNGPPQFTISRNQGASSSLISSNEFSESVTLDLENGTLSSQSSTLDDINGDGLIDIIQPTADRLYIFLNKYDDKTFTTDSFAPPLVVLSHIRGYPEVVVGDIDEDGRPDLAGVDNGGLIILQNKSETGTLKFNSFKRVPFAPGVGGNILLGDLDEDGHIEIIVSAAPSAMKVFKYSGGELSSNAFQKFELPSVGSYPVLVDVERDGRLDIIGDGSVLWNRCFPGQLDPRRFVRLDFPSLKGGVRDAGDLNGDGLVDLIVGEAIVYNQTVVDVITPSSYGHGVNLPDGSDTQSKQFADIDGDSRLDIIGVGSGGRLIVTQNFLDFRLAIRKTSQGILITGEGPSERLGFRSTEYFQSWSLSPASVWRRNQNGEPEIIVQPDGPHKFFKGDFRLITQPID